MGAYSQSTTYLKTFEQMAIVAQRPFTHNTKTYTPPTGGLCISQTLYRVFTCHLGCAGCCPSFTLDYLPYEWDRAIARYPHIEKYGKRIWVELNGNAMPIYSIPTDHYQMVGTTRKCSLLNLTDGSCTIHENNPLSCKVEPGLKFLRIRDTGYIAKRPFGRGWAMMRTDGERGALCGFDAQERVMTPQAIEQVRNVELPHLRQFHSWTQYWAIPTLIPQAIEAIERVLASGTPEQSWIYGWENGVNA